MSNGLPGAARIMKKAAVITRNRVGIATRRRRPMYCSMGAEKPFTMSVRGAGSLETFTRPG